MKNKNRLQLEMIKYYMKKDMGYYLCSAGSVPFSLFSCTNCRFIRMHCSELVKLKRIIKWGNMRKYERTNFSAIIRYKSRSLNNNLNICDSLKPCTLSCSGCDFCASSVLCHRGKDIRKLVKWQIY